MNEQNLPKLIDTLPDQEPVRHHYTLCLLRKQRNLSQKALAEAIGVSIGSVEAWETRRRNPSTESLQKLAEFYDCEVDMLRQDSYTIETAKQIVAEQVALINMKPLEKVNQAERNWLLSVIKTLSPHILVKEKVTQRVSEEGNMAYERAVEKLVLHDKNTGKIAVGED